LLSSDNAYKENWMDRPLEPSTRRSVLYVEDHPVNAMLMSAMFERLPGLDLVVAATGQEALCMAPGLDPVLLLLDLRLPDCHGSDLLPLLRLLPGCESAPAVAVTADGDFDITGTGFVELWAKPLNLQDVLQRVEALVGPGSTSSAPGSPRPRGGDPPVRARNVPTRLMPTWS
jgi:CheY-like chemotaxis protein